MRTSLLMNGINMTGNALFVYGLGMGTAGVALPTLISRMVAAVVITILLFQKRYPVHLQKTLSFGTDRNMIRRILWIGIPNGLENGIFQLGRILTVRIISAFGTTAIAANAVSNKIVMFQIMAGAAVGLSMITVVSQCIGAGSYAQAERYTKKLMKLTYLLCVLLVILTFVALPWINKAYHLSAPTRAIVMKLVIYHGICMVTIWPFAWALPYTLRAAGDVRFTMGVSIASMWIFRIGFGLILGEFLRMGIFGVWIAMTIDWFFRGLCFGYRYFCGTWEKHKI